VADDRNSVVKTWRISKKELASLRLDDEPPGSRRWPWIVALPVLMVAAGTIVWWGYGVFAATEIETTTPRVERSGGAPSGTPLLHDSVPEARRGNIRVLPCQR